MTMDESEPRKRNAAATKAAILESARAAFIRSGYDGAGVREIAEGAGVTAILINRYFGSKEKLFAEVLTRANQNRVIATEQVLTAPDRVARISAGVAQVTRPDATALDGFLIMLRSVANERALEIAREVVQAQQHRSVSEALPGEAAAERAGLLLSIVAGVQIMRQMVQLPALADMSDAALAARLEPLIAALVEG